MQLFTHRFDREEIRQRPSFFSICTSLLHPQHTCSLCFAFREANTVNKHDHTSCQKAGGKAVSRRRLTPAALRRPLIRSGFRRPGSIPGLGSGPPGGRSPVCLVLFVLFPLRAALSPVGTCVHLELTRVPPVKSTGPWALRSQHSHPRERS